MANGMKREELEKVIDLYKKICVIEKRIQRMTIPVPMQMPARHPNEMLVDGHIEDYVDGVEKAAILEGLRLERDRLNAYMGTEHQIRLTD